MKETKLACFSLACGLYWGQSVSDHYAEGSININKKTANTSLGRGLSFCCFPEGSTNLNFFTPFMAVQNHSGLSQVVNGSLHHLTTSLQRFTSVLRLISLKSGEFASFLVEVSGRSMFVTGYTNTHGDQQIYCCDTSYHKAVSVAIFSYILKGGVA